MQNEQWLPSVLENMGALALQQQDPERAISVLEESIGLLRGLQYTWMRYRPWLGWGIPSGGSAACCRVARRMESRPLESSDGAGDHGTLGGRVWPWCGHRRRARLSQ